MKFRLYGRFIEHMYVIFKDMYDKSNDIIYFFNKSPNMNF